MTANPMHNSIPQVYMVAVLRYADKSVVAVYSASKEVTKEGIRECVAGNAKIQSGRRYTVEGESQAIHYTLDPQGRVYALVTNPKYSPRVAFIALDELQKQFGKEFGPRVASASEETLNKPARVLLKEISDRLVSVLLVFDTYTGGVFIPHRPQQICKPKQRGQASSRAAEDRRGQVQHARQHPATPAK